MDVAHVALELGARHQRRHRVDHDDVEGAGADQHVGDLERLLPRVRLRDEQLVNVDADRPGVDRVEGVLGVDERRHSPVALCLGDNVQGQRRLSARLRPVYLNDPTPGHATDAESEVEGQRPGGDGVDLTDLLVAQFHDGALAELTLDLGHRHLETLFPVALVFGHDGLLLRLPRTYRAPVTDSRPRTTLMLFKEWSIR